MAWFQTVKTQMFINRILPSVCYRQLFERFAVEQGVIRLAYTAGRSRIWGVSRIWDVWFGATRGCTEACTFPFIDMLVVFASILFTRTFCQSSVDRVILLYGGIVHELRQVFEVWICILSLADCVHLSDPPVSKEGR